MQLRKALVEAIASGAPGPRSAWLPVLPV